MAEGAEPTQGLNANDLHAALLELVRECRQQQRFRDALWTQLMLPVTTAVVAFLAIVILIVFLVPRFLEPVYERLYWCLRLELP